MIQEAKKAPHLERYVGGYIHLIVCQPVHIIKLSSMNTRARHAGADSHVGIDHSCKKVTLNMTLAY